MHLDPKRKIGEGALPRVDRAYGPILFRLGRDIDWCADDGLRDSNADSRAVRGFGFDGEMAAYQPQPLPHTDQTQSSSPLCRLDVEPTARVRNAKFNFRRVAQ